MQPELLVCCECRTPLIQEGTVLHCKTCGATCVYHEGIYDFLDDHSPYWGEISPEEMEQTLQRARSKGWRTAATDLGFKYPGRNEYILSNARIDWLFHCLDLTRTGSCLDIGSGWGTLAFGLAGYYDEVWSLEAVKQRLEFQKIRREQDEADNIKFIRADWLNLPFPDNHFDLVAANGVLEWLGLSDYSRNPRDVQVDFLKEARRVLKPGGCLYVGIENRFGLLFLLGSKDHSGLPFTSLLPRKTANLVVKLCGKAGEYRQWGKMEKWKDYRTYTHSYWGYEKLLREAGFDQTEQYWTLSYNNPKQSGKFDGESFACLLKSTRERTGDAITLRSFITLIAVHLPNRVIKLGLPFICPSFLIYAYKQERMPSFESKVLELESHKTGFIKLGGSHGTSSKVTYIALNNSKPCSFIKFPRFKEDSSLALEEGRMSQFNQMNIEQHSIDGKPIYVEPAIKGAPFKPGNLAHNQKVLTWLINFQRATQTGYWDHGRLEARVAALDGFLQEMDIDKGLQSRTQHRLQVFLESLQQVKLPVTAEHGDFGPGNVLIGDDGRVYVLDWELYQDKGDPLFDFVFFIIINSVRARPDAFHDTFVGRGKYAGILEVVVPEFAKEYGLSVKHILDAVTYALVRRLYGGMRGDTHMDIASYHRLLVLWDEACLGGSSPYNHHISNSPLA